MHSHDGNGNYPKQRSPTGKYRLEIADDGAGDISDVRTVLHNVGDDELTPPPGHQVRHLSGGHQAVRQPPRDHEENTSPGFEPPRPTGAYTSPGFNAPISPASSHQAGGYTSPGFNAPTNPARNQPGEQTSGGFLPPGARPAGAFTSPGFTPPTNPAQAGGNNQDYSSPGFSAPQQSMSAQEYTSTGFIPAEHFKAQIAAAANKKAEAPTTEMRIKYGVSAALAGALTGGLLGVVNMKLQGFTSSQGSPQILVLISCFTLIFGVIAAMRPERLEQVLLERGLLDPSDVDPGKK